MTTASERQRTKYEQRLARGQPLPAILEAHDGRTATGTLYLLRLGPAERGARARTWLFAFLAAAPVAAVLPPHLPWPLLMITVGVVGYYLRRGRAELVLGGEGTCPACQAAQLLDAGNAEFPMAHHCTACRRRSLVRPQSAAAPPPP